MVTINLMKDINNNRAYVEAHNENSELLFAHMVTTYHKAENLVREMKAMLEKLGHNVTVVKNY
jgi:hypothetical protein